MTLRIVGITCATLVLIAMTASAQQRDRVAAPPPAPAAGTGAISGVLTAAGDSAVPVRRALVSLTSGDGLSGRTVVTDDKGAFTFRALAAGRYTLSAQKAAHLKNSYGAKRPGRPGTSIMLGEGQQLTDVNFALPRGGVIAGTLRLDTGEPLPDTQVLAIPVDKATAGGRFLKPVEFQSDDQGAYRIYGLPTGTYLLAALPSVGFGEVETRSDAQFDAITRQVTQAAGATAAATMAPAETPDLRGYAPTYFPGTSTVTNAVPITVAAGEVKDDVDVTITMFKMSTITGTVMGTDGRPAEGARLAADAVGPPLPLTGASTARAGRPDAAGRFTISNMPPGRYRISARSASQTEWALVDVEVTGENIDGVHLTLQTGLNFQGQVVAENAPPEGLKGAQVTVQAVGTSTDQAMLNGMGLSVVLSRAAAVDASGRFNVTGIQPGMYEVTLRLPGLGSAWGIRAITVGERDLRDGPLTFETGSITGATVVLTDQRSEVAGTLSSGSGLPASDYYVVIFAADRALWHAASPRVRVVRPGADGAFSARDLPAGDYRIAALTDVEDDEWKSVAFLTSLLEASLPIVVKDAATTRQDLRIR